MDRVLLIQRKPLSVGSQPSGENLPGAQPCVMCAPNAEDREGLRSPRERWRPFDTKEEGPGPRNFWKTEELKVHGGGSFQMGTIDLKAHWPWTDDL